MVVHLRTNTGSFGVVGGAAWKVPGAQLLFSGSKAADTEHVNTGVNGVCLGARADGKTVGVGVGQTSRVLGVTHFSGKVL